MRLLRRFDWWGFPVAAFGVALIVCGWVPVGVCFVLVVMS